MANQIRPPGGKSKVRSTWSVIQGGKSQLDEIEVIPIEITDPIVDVMELLEHCQQQHKIKFKSVIAVGVLDNDEIILVNDPSVVDNNAAISYLTQATHLAVEFFHNRSNDGELD